MGTTGDATVLLVTAENAHLLDRVDPDVFDHEVRPDLLRQLLGNPMNHLAVAVVDGIVVGMASAISYVHPDKPLQLFINEVGVAGGYRRRGIARRLMDLIIDHGRRLGCTEAWVATEVGNTAARALYRATGGVEDEERAVVFTYELGSRS
jgi:aminoglycoside 6'-N-acetyltransferase I